MMIYRRLRLDAAIVTIYIYNYLMYTVGVLVFKCHYKPQVRFSGDCDVQRRDLGIFLKGEAPSLLF